MKGVTVMEIHKNRENVISRLAKIEGHIRGIKNMAEQDKSCEELLHQVSAVKAAMDKVGKLILKDHLDNCLGDIIKEGQDSDAVQKLKDAIDHFAR